jgi:hypothetical protein
VLAVLAGHFSRDAKDAVLFVTDGLEPVEVIFLHVADAVEDSYAGCVEVSWRFGSGGWTTVRLEGGTDTREDRD